MRERIIRVCSNNAISYFARACARTAVPSQNQGRQGTREIAVVAHVIRSKFAGALERRDRIAEAGARNVGEAESVPILRAQRVRTCRAEAEVDGRLALALEPH
jgi:hypothetical protein